MLVVALLLELLLVLDFLHRLAVFCVRTTTNWRCHGVADGQAENEDGRLHLEEKFDLFVRSWLEATAVFGGGLQTFYRDATTAARSLHSLVPW